MIKEFVVGGRKFRYVRALDLEGAREVAETSWVRGTRQAMMDAEFLGDHSDELPEELKGKVEVIFPAYVDAGFPEEMMRWSGTLGKWGWRWARILYDEHDVFITSV